LPWGPPSRSDRPHPEAADRAAADRVGPAPRRPQPAARPKPIAAPEPDPALEERLRAAGAEIVRAQDDAERHALATLRDAGRAVRLRGEHYAHPETVDAVRREVVGAIESDGSITLAGLRDRLGIARRQAQALLEELDRERVTRRLPDDSRVLSRKLVREGKA